MTSYVSFLSSSLNCKIKLYSIKSPLFCIENKEETIINMIYMIEVSGGKHRPWGLKP